MNPTDMVFEHRRPAWSRPETVFIVASLTLLLAFLVPLTPAVLGVLWVCTFCLAGAVTIICVAAASSADLIGFVPLVSGLTLLRLAATAAAARRLIQQQPADPLLQSTGAFLAGQWPLGAVLIGLLLTAVVSVVVFASSQKIALASTGYIGRILPLKRIGIETDLRMGVIDQDQARVLAGRIGSEFRFFAGMQGASLLMRGETAICVVILLACVLFPMLGGPDTGSGTAFLTQTAPAITALAVFAMVPLAIVAACCGRMMSHDTLALRPESDLQHAAPAKKISIITKEAGTQEEIEILNPDALSLSPQQIVDFEPSAEHSSASAPVCGHSFRKELEKLQTITESKASGRLENKFSCRTAESYYDKLSRSIVSASLVRVLMAANSLKDLPVTVAVNVAIRLAQKQKKTLLVDTDTTRHPLARVFDLDPQTLLKKTLGTCFENLSVCTVPTAKIPALLKNTDMLRRFDVMLVYAPECGDLRKETSGQFEGFFFTENPAQTDLPPCFHSLKTVPSIHVALNGSR